MSAALQRQGHGYLLAAFAVTLLAAVLREWFVLATVVEAPIRGDIVQYVAYAWNLVVHQTFSMAAPGSAEVTPDAFRGPGYPLLLVVAMLLGGLEGGWYPLALQGQVLLGTATVALTMVLGRRWLSMPANLLAGGLIAVWPHHIAATGALLTEVAFGFFLVAGLCLAASPGGRGRQATGLALATGAVFAFACLVNEVILLFPLLIAVMWWRAGRKRGAVIVAVIPLLVAGAWDARSALLPPAPADHDRVAMNLVQGSWPLYHAAYASRDAHETPRRILQAIVAEQRLMATDPAAGLKSIGERIAHDPGYYARWYFFEKPFLLWDWDIRIGAGDVYFHRLSQSPLDEQPLLRALKRALEWLNPAIFVVSAGTALMVVLRWRRSPPQLLDRRLLVALFAVYATAIHWVFQAEPRYSIPYRPEQMLLLAAGLSCITRWAIDRVRQRSQPATNAS